MQSKFGTILISGMKILLVTMILSDFTLVLVLHLHFQGCDNSKKAVGLSSGQVMTRRH